MNMRRAVWILFLLLAGVARAALPGAAGHYDLTLTTDPAVIPVGTAELVITVSLDDKPLEGVQVTTFTHMPGMRMGERPETARPVAGQPGVYRARAAFPMGGAYQVQVTVSGPHGTAETTFSVATGEDVSAGRFPGWILPTAVGLILLVLIAWRMRVTGQRLEPGRFLDRQVLGGLFLIGVMLLGSVLAVRHFRRPGSMTPLEAQVMEMDMPAPVGVTPVVLVAARRGPVEEVLRYTGQALPLDEQVVTARTTGVVEWMPFYLGDRVTRGQTLARLDTTLLEPRLAASRAAERMAENTRSLAEGERLRQQAELERARAQSEAARAAREVAANRILAAEAEVQAALAEQDYRVGFLARSRELAREGALSEEELQRDQAEAAGAEARVRAARARLDEARAGLRQAEAELAAGGALVEAASAAHQVAAGRLGEAEAGQEMARSQSAAAAAERGYSELKAALDGVVTERAVSPGTLVQPGQVLLRVARVDPIRLQANVAERDLEEVQVGNRVRVSRPGGGTVEGRLSAVRPAVEPASRQGLVEAVLPNQENRFLPGSYVAMEILTRRVEKALLVPTSALLSRVAPAEGASVPQDSRTWVWVARGQAPELRARRVQVTLGPSDGLHTAITSGLAEGDLVVASGYENLQDEGPVVEATPRGLAESGGGEVQAVTIRVSSRGFTPARLELQAGVPARLTFLRVDEQNCGTEVVFPSLGLRRDLPLNQPVVVEIPPQGAQKLDFSCGMDMLKGQVLVR